MNLPDALMAQVKQRASEAGATVTSVVEEALRRYLLSPDGPGDRRVELPVWGNPDDEPLVELTPDLIRQLEEEDDIARYLRAGGQLP